MLRAPARSGSVRRAASVTTGVLLIAAAWNACVDPRCFEDADCAVPAICGADGRCRVECRSDDDCSALFACDHGRCRPRPSPTVRCPDDMVPIAGAFCMDRHEASRTDATAVDDGDDESFARSVAGVLPWQVADNATATGACAAAGKRLCAADEWRLACRGPADTDYPYGDRYDPTACNGIDAFGRTSFHLASTGDFERCVNAWGAFDLSGNLWEHVAGGDDTTVRGGAYNCSDSAMLHRCDYVPGSWVPSARGFRCCSRGIVVHDAGTSDATSEDAGPTDGGGCVVDGAAIADARATDHLGVEDASASDLRVVDRASPPDQGVADHAVSDHASTQEDAWACDGSEDAGCPCPDDMVAWGASCIDRYEASREDATALHQGSATGRAFSRAGVVPWYVSSMSTQAHLDFEAACQAAGKRLCRSDEWLDLCTGGGLTDYATGNGFEAWRCNSVETYCQACCDVLGLASCPTASNCGYSSQLTSSYTPEICGLSQPYSLESCHVCYHVAPTGAFPQCSSAAGALDVNGNVWEVVTTPSGGYQVRGGAFNCGSPATRFRCDFDATWSALYAGFRCCRDRP
ncbi:MAG: SUMF1/EgtB/PvdO family nonheme iron enzyme [Pseudomonadota bacterium]